MKYILFFALSIILSYAVEWSPYYVALFSDKSIQIDGTIQKFRQPCIKPNFKEMKCTDSFVIPKSRLNLQTIESVGLGIFISATDIYCSNPESSHIRLGDTNSPSRALELLKTYETVDLNTISCNGDLIVDVWGGSAQRRSGYIGSSLVLGESNFIVQVKRVVEFFTTQFHFLISLILISCLLITQIVLRPLISKSKKYSFFEKHSFSWVTFSILKSGIPEILFPAISTNLFFVRIANFFSSIAHTSPAISALGSSKGVSKHFDFLMKVLNKKVFSRIPLTVFHAIVLIICLSPFFAKFLGFIGFICMFLYVVAAIQYRNLSFLLFSFNTAFETAKLFNFHYVPYGSTTLTYVTFILIDIFVKRIRYGVRVSSLLLWSKSVKIKNYESLKSTVRHFSERFDINQVTLIEARRGGSCRITIQKKNKNGKWESEELSREQIPKIFSHVLTTREALWNIHENSDLAISLRRGDSKRSDTDGRHFTVLPVLKDGNAIGGIAFTSYPTTLFSEDSSLTEFQLGTQLLTPLISYTLWAEGTSKSDDWYRRCAHACDKILSLSDKLKSSTDIKLILEEALKLASEAVGFPIFCAHVNPTTREYDLKIAVGYSDEVKNLYMKTSFYALAGNTQGPMPLAINKKMIMIVTDINWIASLLHPLSLKILEHSQCQSAAAVPIFSIESGVSDISENNHVWGLLWFESKKVGEFTSSQETGLRSIAAAMEGLLSQINITTRAQMALEGLVRKDIAEKLLNSQIVREEDTGYLLVADIRGSTQIANNLGAEAWNSFVEYIQPAIEHIASKYNLILQLIIWDAFHFTSTAKNHDPSKIDDFILFANELGSLLEYTYNMKFKNIAKHGDGSRARFCLEFGDTTRDIQNGMWTISGATMASVSKLESICKKLTGWFFITENTPPNFINKFTVTNEINPGTGFTIMSYKEGISVASLDEKILRLLKDQNKDIKKAVNE